jgi:hypothetical protein
LPDAKLMSPCPVKNHPSFFGFQADKFTLLASASMLFMVVGDSPESRSPHALGEIQTIAWAVLTGP